MEMLAELFTLNNLWVVGVIFFLEMVLGFDNLLYISIESAKAPIADQERVRKTGIFLAVILRVVLLFVTVQLIKMFEMPFLSFNAEGSHNNINLPVNWISGEFTFQTIVFIVGGMFLMYTAVKEISHMLAVDNLHDESSVSHSSVTKVMANILLMNIVFSFDSTLTAMAISKVFVVMAAGIVLSGIAMYLIADAFAAFLQKNRMYEVLGLFVLLIVGVSLLGEGGHLGHLTLFGVKVEPLAKSTFYFSIAVLFIVEIIQTRYQRALENKRKH